MPGGPIYHVPAGSSPLRELAHAIEEALTLPKPATEREELTYLRVARGRARLVREIMREILRDIDIEHDPDDIMALVARLRRHTKALPGGSPATPVPGQEW